MRRTGLFLMAVFLAAPMLRECCAPILVTQHCHQSEGSDKPSCSPNPDAITANRTFAFFSIHFGFAEGKVIDSAVFESTGTALDEPVLSRTHTVDLYLRTGSLLI